MLKRALFAAFVIFLTGCSSHAMTPSPVNQFAGPSVIQKQPLDMGWAVGLTRDTPLYSPITVGKSIYFVTGSPSLVSASMDLQFTGRTFGPGVSDGYSVAFGSDGNFWAGGFHYIAKLVPGGAETDYTVPGSVRSIVAGPDGALWFTGVGSAVGRISTDGAVTIYPVTANGLGQIAVGPDGNLWIADSGVIHKMTAAGVDTAYPTTFPATNISPGPDGAMYFTWRGGATTFGRITTDGTASIINAPEAGATVSNATLGPAGALWTVATDPNGNQGIQIYYPKTNSFGQFIQAPPIKNGAQPIISGITGGPDGNVWVTVGYSTKIAYVMVYARLAMTVTPSSLTLTSGTNGTLTVSEKVHKGGWTASSSAKSIATVSPESSSSFTVTGVATGKCTITIADGQGNSVPVKVTVQ